MWERDREPLRSASMLDPLLSLRGGTTVSSLERPWRFAERGDFDADTNPKGLVAFSTAENARAPILS